MLLLSTDHFLPLRSAAQRSAPGGEQSWPHRSTVIPEMQRMPVTTVTWPLDDTGPLVRPTPGLPHTVLAFRPDQVSHSKQTATRHSSAQAFTAVFFFLGGGVCTAAEIPQSTKAGSIPTLPARATANLMCSGQSPWGSDRSRLRSSPVRLSDFPRSPGEAQPESDAGSQS